MVAFAYDFLGWLVAAGGLTSGAGVLTPVFANLLSTVSASRVCLLRAMGTVEATWMMTRVARTESSSISRCFVCSATTGATEGRVELLSSAVWLSLGGQSGANWGVSETGPIRCGLVIRPRLVVRPD